LRILITGCGAPGIKGTIYSLKNNIDGRKIDIIGTDVNAKVVGKYLCDKFYRIPKAVDTENYLDSLFNISEKEKIDIIIPQNTSELNTLASNKDKFGEIETFILVSDERSLKIANNRFKLMRICKEIGLPVANFSIANNIEDLYRRAEELGWPRNKIVVKPPVSNGMRGVRIIDENIDLKKLFYDEKPTNLYIKMEDLYKILGNTFPELIIMEYLPGEEYTVDVFRNDFNTTVIPRKRTMIRSGITFNGITEKNEEIIDYTNKITEEIGLKYCFGFQFKLDENGGAKIIESNPRVQGTMILSTFSGANIIYASIKDVLGEKFIPFDISWGTKILRYWGGVAVVKNNSIIYL
jgi:carbamoyl-phosphate synthase large subunit